MFDDKITIHAESGNNAIREIMALCDAKGLEYRVESPFSNDPETLEQLKRTFPILSIASLTIGGAITFYNALDDETGELSKQYLSPIVDVSMNPVVAREHFKVSFDVAVGRFSEEDQQAIWEHINETWAIYGSAYDRKLFQLVTVMCLGGGSYVMLVWDNNYPLTVVGANYQLFRFVYEPSQGASKPKLDLDNPGSFGYQVDMENLISNPPYTRTTHGLIQPNNKDSEG